MKKYFLLSITFVLLSLLPAQPLFSAEKSGTVNDISLIRKMLANGETYKAIELIQSKDNEREITDKYFEITTGLYWKEKELTGALTIGTTGINYMLLKADEYANSDPVIARTIKGKARSLAFNLASYCWPGWEQEGIDISGEQVLQGLSLAKLNLKLVRELEEGSYKESIALWSIGAQYLSLNDFKQARQYFEQASDYAEEAGIIENTLMNKGYIAITEILETENRESSANNFATIRESLQNIGSDDGQFYAKQLNNVLGFFRFENGKIKGVEKIEDLDRQSVFSFAIMSDNKGDSPASKTQFAKMVQWIKESEDKFVIGLGDHVKIGWKNDFLPFLHENKWWHDNFYPNVADGENEFYGKGQDDWGAGGKILLENKINEKQNVSVRKNGCEYYAQIKVKDYTVHLIQLHFPDEPKDIDIAFNEDTRKYLMDTLNSIDKGAKGIIIVAAHSRKGSWIEYLPEYQRKTVMEKADLVLSATTHFYKRIIPEGYENKGALCFNTGSITYPTSFAPPGFVQIHVLEEPLTLVVQYINTNRPRREMQFSEFANMKIVNGPVIDTNFREPRLSENMDLTVGEIDRNYSKGEMSEVIKTIYKNITGCDYFYRIGAMSALKAGKISRRNLWSVAPYNNEIWCLTLSADELKELMDISVDRSKHSTVKVAISSWFGRYVAEKFKLPEDRIFRSGRNETELLQKWVEKQ